jgi:hypothetical protein
VCHVVTELESLDLPDIEVTEDSGARANANSPTPSSSVDRFAASDGLIGTRRSVQLSLIMNRASASYSLCFLDADT